MHGRRARATRPAPLEAMDGTVASALLELGEVDRNLILLYAWAGLSYEQLADGLAIPLGTVRSRLNRIRAKLRVALAPVPAVEGAES
jgi:RNA polymerase sigma factor (sigma-70 family)